MRKFCIVLVFIFSHLFLFVIISLSQPNHINYQGVLLKDGIHFSGIAEFKFVIHDSLRTLWSNDGSSVNKSEPNEFVPINVEDGIFNVQLGAFPMYPIKAEIFSDISYAALRIWVNTGDGFDQLSDQPLSSVPFALQSNSSSVEDDGDWIQSGNNLYRLIGNVGVGTSNPQTSLHIVDGKIRIGTIANAAPVTIESGDAGASGLLVSPVGSNLTGQIAVTPKGNPTGSAKSLVRVFMTDATNDPVNYESVSLEAHSDGNYYIKTRTEPQTTGLHHPFRFEVGGHKGFTIYPVTLANGARFNHIHIGEWFPQSPNIEDNNPILFLHGGTGIPNSGRSASFQVDSISRHLNLGSWNGFAIYTNVPDCDAPTKGTLGLFQNNQGNIGIGKEPETNNKLHVNGNTMIDGDLMVKGAKNALVETSKGTKKVYSEESAEVWFSDYGIGKLKLGHSHIELDSTYLEAVTISEKNPLMVFIQLNDDCKGTYVKTGFSCFDVYEIEGGKSNASFSYRVMAKRKGYEKVRFGNIRK